MSRSTLAALLIAAAAPTLAAPPLPAPETRASATAKLDAEFTRMDANGDGVLTKPEVAARIGRMGANGRTLSPQQQAGLTDMWFARADANHDGRVTREEARTAMARVFNQYDRNGDGKVGPAEERAARAQLKATAAQAR